MTMNSPIPDALLKVLTFIYGFEEEEFLGEMVEVPCAYEPVFPRLSLFRSFKQALFRHQMNAKKRCDRIDATAPENQRLLVLKHRHAYVSYPVIEELLRRVKQVVFDDPVRAEGLARLALLIAEELTSALPHVRRISLCREAQARAHAHVGNVCRVLCKWPEAEEHLLRAQELQWQGTGDPVVLAEILSLQGSFFSDVRRLDDAIAVLQKAVNIYQDIEDRHQAGIALLQLAGVYRLDNKPDLALPVHLEGSALVDEDRYPIVAAVAWNNLVRILLDLGRLEDAQSILHSAPGFFDACPTTSTAHCDRIWTEGNVHRRLEHFSEALHCFDEAYERFRERQDPYNAAQVQLDKLRVLVQQGRLLEVEHLAYEVYEMLRSEPLKKEAEEALEALCLAASQRRLVESIIEDVVVLLQRQSFPPVS